MNLQLHGTSDCLGVITMPTDAKFVRVAQVQGVDFGAFDHDPVQYHLAKK